VQALFRILVVSLALLSLVVAARADWREESPTSACKYLSDTGLGTGTWKQEWGDNWFCCSPYKDLSRVASLPNNIAYYVLGSQTKVSELQLVLNINKTSEKDATDRAILLRYARILTQKATGHQLSKTLASCISEARAGHATLDASNLIVKREKTKNGYTLYFFIK
jgi:hypothetical protein